MCVNFHPSGGTLRVHAPCARSPHRASMRAPAPCGCMCVNFYFRALRNDACARSPQRARVRVREFSPFGWHPAVARSRVRPLRNVHVCVCVIFLFAPHSPLRSAAREHHPSGGVHPRVHVRTPAVCSHHLRWVRFAPKNHFSFGILTLRVNIPLGCTSRARAKPPCRIGSHKIFAVNGLYLKILCGSGRSLACTFRQK